MQHENFSLLEACNKGGGVVLCMDIMSYYGYVATPIKSPFQNFSVKKSQVFGKLQQSYMKQSIYAGLQPLTKVNFSLNFYLTLTYYVPVQMLHGKRGWFFLSKYYKQIVLKLQQIHNNLTHI